MDLDQARLELAGILGLDCKAPPTPERLNAARQWLIARGTEALRIEPATAPALADVIRDATSAPASPPRQSFAVLIVAALPVPGLLSSRTSRARLERDVCALIETALPHVLLRAGYPFGAELDVRQRHLVMLAASIDEDPAAPGAVDPHLAERPDAALRRAAPGPASSGSASGKPGRPSPGDRNATVPCAGENPTASASPRSPAGSCRRGRAAEQHPAPAAPAASAARPPPAS